MNSKFDLIALLRSVYRHRRFIIIFVLLVSVGAVTYALLTPKYWKSSAVVSVTSQSSPFPGMLKGLISSYSSGLGDLAGNDEAELQLQVLQSRGINEGAIRKFHLINYFRIKQSAWQKDSLMVMDEMLKTMKKKVMGFGLDEVTGTITVAATTKDKQLSVDLANYYVTQLDNYNRYVRVTNGRAKREFMEKRVDQIQNDIKESSEKLAAFQQQHNIVNLDEQVSAGLQAYGDILKTKIQTATEMEFAKSYYAKDNPKVEELDKRLQAINKEIDQMQSSKVIKYMPSFDKINDLGVQYVQQKMHLEILEEVLKNLIPQMELTRLEELNDMTTIQYIDHPTKDGLRERPKRAKICIIAFFAAAMVGCFLSILYDLLASQKSRFSEIFKDN